MTPLLLALVLAGPAPVGGARVDVNKAGVVELITLPGIGKTIAGRIVESRTSAGPFTSAEDLRRVKGIGTRTLDKLRPLISIGGKVPSAAAPGSAGDKGAAKGKPRAIHGRVNINTATAGELRALPGIGPKTASAVVMDRNTQGPFRTVEELTRVKGIGKGKLAKLLPFISVGESPAKRR
jgi:competence protein ComEA